MIRFLSLGRDASPRRPLWITLSLRLCVLSVAGASLISVNSSLEATEKPNIVLIMADDLGYGSVNCYGADTKHIRTPNIDRIAAEGIKFTDANTPGSVCSPTRYGLLTGRYSWRGRMKYGVLSPPEGALLVEDELTTLPEYLKEQGYQTAQIGKWHLGYTNMREVKDMSAQSLEPGPRSMGFDYHFAVPNNIDWLPKVYVENEGIWGLRSKGRNPYGKSSYKGQQYHGYDAPQRVTTEVSQDLSDSARNWIFKTVKNNPDEPFFLFFAPVAIHNPIAPSDKWRGTSGIGAYGDYIHDLDYSVGEILNALSYTNVLDDTLVIFTSDNGGDLNGVEEKFARERGFKINGELRGDKHLIYEGGFKVPFVARWPGKIKAGTTSTAMVNLVDTFSTFQEMISGEVESSKNKAADSFSFYSELVGKTKNMTVRDTMVINDVTGVHAIRKGDWKYIEGKRLRPLRKNEKVKDNPQLYNLANDPDESENLLKKNPDKVKEMQALLDKIRNEGTERIVAEK